MWMGMKGGEKEEETDITGHIESVSYSVLRSIM